MPVLPSVCTEYAQLTSLSRSSHVPFDVIQIDTSMAVRDVLSPQSVHKTRPANRTRESVESRPTSRSRAA